ncbi:FadR/GntR family transcriptional regulator [Pseudonocardia xishanensis]|uniref:FCD domain-containing protein n=1 Tax=Pseudonocardia xishanensis TaxID=630995 RepID=A0ABP8RUB8_9PSEU
MDVGPGRGDETHDRPSTRTVEANPFERMSAPSWGQLTRAVKTSERIATALVQDIIDAGLGPGDRLPNEAAMVERFGVGRGSVREALRILEVHGLIELRAGPKGGPFITAIDPRNVSRTLSLYLSLRGATMEELVQTRLFLEPMVARLAAENCTPESAELLRATLAQAPVSGGSREYLEAANDFHYVLATMTGNRVLDLVSTALKELYTSRLVGTGVGHATTDPSIELEHQEICTAIVRGDADTAERLMRTHMEYYVERVRQTAPEFRASRLAWE